MTTKKKTTEGPKEGDAAAVWMDPKALVPWKDNPRENDGEPVESVIASITDFGFGAPVVARQANNEIIKGHTRTKAAIAMGLDLIPVRLLEISEEDAHELALVDNKTGELAKWSPAKLKAELTKIKARREAEAKEAAPIGWKPRELAHLLREKKKDPKEVDSPEPPSDPVTKEGDVWKLGRHLLMCKDSTIIEWPPVEVLLTDPPFSSGAGSATRQDARKALSTSIGSKRGGKNITILRDNMTTSGYLAFMRALLARIPAAFSYVFTDWRMWHWTTDALESTGHPVRGMLVWDKLHAGMGQPWRSQHELIAYTSRGAAQKPTVGADSGNVLRFARSGNKHHPTEKPVPLLCALLENTPAKTVADPFGGSGSTLIAAEQAGWACTMAELSPAFCDVVIERWQNLTGGKATRS